MEITAEDAIFIRRVLMSWDYWWMDTRESASDEDLDMLFSVSRRLNPGGVMIDFYNSIFWLHTLCLDGQNH